jgi:hypothetical protein
MISLLYAGSGIPTVKLESVKVFPLVIACVVLKVLTAKFTVHEQSAHRVAVVVTDTVPAVTAGIIDSRPPAPLSDGAAGVHASTAQITLATDPMVTGSAEPDKIYIVVADATRETPLSRIESLRYAIFFSFLVNIIIH